MHLALGILLLITQLSAPGGQLPQIMSADFKIPPIAAGKVGEVGVSFKVIDGFAINRIPPIQLKLTPVAGVTLRQTDFVSTSDDPKSKDEYFVDLPTLKVPIRAAKAGKYQITGKLVYFFCSKADGFCSRQVIDVKIPMTVQ